MRKRGWIVVGALGIGVLAGCPGPRAGASGGGTAARSSHALTHSWVVKPGKVAEANVHLGAGAQLKAEFSATDLMQWNIHSHTNGQVTTHQQGEGTAGTIEFTAPAEGSYSLMWQNDNSTTVKLEVTMTGGGEAGVLEPVGYGWAAAGLP